MKTSLALFALTVFLFSLGLIMIFNTTSAEIMGRESLIDPHFAMMKQISYSIIGLILSGIVYALGYRKMIEYSLLFYLGTVVFLILVFVPHIGMLINGARRWINIGGISLQPSEFAKVILPLFYLRLLMGRKTDQSFWSFVKWQIPFMIPVFLIILEPDNGTAAILLTTLVVLFFVTQIKWLYWVIPIALVATTGVCLAYNMKHARDRIYIYLHPEADLLGRGHQPYQAKIAAGSGGLVGRGLGESLQKLNYLPEARSDYIAAIFAEEFGFLGIALLILLYVIITMLGFRISITSPDIWGYYLGVTFTFIIAFQAFLNLGVVSGVLPSKGTNLPFFSQGGSSLWANMIMVATLINIHMTALKEKRVV